MVPLIIDFSQRLDAALSHFDDTISQLDALLADKRSPQEIVLLACARLDSLANLAYGGQPSSRKAFRQFVSEYSGQKGFFNSLSAGDLYRYFQHYGDLAVGGLVQTPGRIHRFGPESDEFLAFVQDSGIPVTGDSIQRIAHRVASALQSSFRVKPRQSLSKPYMDAKAAISATIAKEFRSPPAARIVSALDEVLDKFKASAILYDRYRNRAIHGFRVGLDSAEFFDKAMPFHGEFIYYAGTVFQLEFPGHYLRNLLSTSLGKYRAELLNTRKLPFDLLLAMFSFEELLEGEVMELLADDALEDFEEVRWRLRTR